MKNRKLNAVLTRFGIIAAILATLVLIAPAVSAADPLKLILRGEWQRIRYCDVQCD